MSIIDELTKWALGKVDERFFDKKDVSTEEHLKELYLLMEKMPEACKNIAHMIHPFANGMEDWMLENGSLKTEIKCGVYNPEDLVVELKELGLNDDAKDIRADILEIRTKGEKNVFEPIYKHVQSLKFDFDRTKGFRGFAEEMIKQFDDLHIILAQIEKFLGHYQAAIEAEDAGSYLYYFEWLKKYETRLIEHADNFKATVDKLLKFTREIK